MSQLTALPTIVFIMYRLNYRLLTLAVVITYVSSCRPDKPNTATDVAVYISNPKYGIVLTKEQGPFHLQMGLLPEHYLQTVHQIKSSAASTHTVTFRLQLKTIESTNDLSEAMQAAAPPDWSADQVQTALLYHMDNSATLVIGKKVITSVVAVAEAGPNTKRLIQIAFTFPVAEQELLSESEVQVILANTFFLTTPITFTFKSADLQKVI